MSRIGITGHRNLDEAVSSYVQTEIHRLLQNQDHDSLIGLSCLADGADTIFAQAIVDLGATLEVIIPATEYRSGLPVAHHAKYDRLLDAAAAVHRLERLSSTSEAHMAASELLLEQVEQIYAVWDGEPARGYGSTADVVTAARDRDLPVSVIWPEGVVRG